MSYICWREVLKYGKLLAIIWSRLNSRCFYIPCQQAKRGPKALKLKFLISRGFSDGNNTFDSRCGLEKVDGEYKFTVGNGHKVWQGEIVIFPDFY